MLFGVCTCLCPLSAQTLAGAELRAADVNADGVINVLDLTLVAADFGKRSDMPPLPTDVNGDGNVNVLDLTLTARHFGKNVPPAAAFVDAEPMDGAELAVDGTVLLTFDRMPEALAVSVGTLTVQGEKVTVSGPFPAGAFGLRVTWADGSTVLAYTVIAPDTEPPQLTRSSVRGGDDAVDGTALDEIVLTFSEPVTGEIALRTAAGVDVEWVGTVSGRTGTLTRGDGGELGYAARYVIAGTVADAAGNETAVRIQFTTDGFPPGVPILVTDATFESIVLGSTVPIVVEFKDDG